MTSARARLALWFAAAALGGCAVVPAHDYGQRYDPAPAVTVYAAPPAPLVEYRSLPPAQGHVWLDGYWNWGGARYIWVPGRWQNPPPGHTWVPRVWQRDGERWHSHGGHWQQHLEDRRPPPQSVWPRREFQPQPPPPQYQRSPEPWRRQEWRPESQPEPQRRTEGPLHRVLSEAQRMAPAVVRPEPPPRPAEATPQRRDGEEGRRMDRRRPEDGEPHDRR